MPWDTGEKQRETRTRKMDGNGKNRANWRVVSYSDVPDIYVHPTLDASTPCITI